MSSFGVGLVSYNMTSKEINSLTLSFREENPEYMVVVDNSPLPKSRKEFEKSGWEYIHNPLNPGFGASHNLIFNKYGKTVDYHLVVNPDIVFSGKVISNLAEFLDATSDAGCVMPKIYYPNGRIQLLAKLLPAPQDWIIRRLPFKTIKNKINRRLELHCFDHESGTFKIPFASGCFLLLKTKVIADIGFFDERFFMYCEDSDLSRRLWENLSYPYYTSCVSVTHQYRKGSSTNFILFLTHEV